MGTDAANFFKQDSLCPMFHATRPVIQQGGKGPSKCSECEGPIENGKIKVACNECEDFSICLNCVKDPTRLRLPFKAISPGIFKAPPCMHKMRLMPTREIGSEHLCSTCKAHVATYYKAFHCSLCDKFECLMCALTGTSLEKVKKHKCGQKGVQIVRIKPMECTDCGRMNNEYEPMMFCSGCNAVTCIHGCLKKGFVPAAAAGGEEPDSKPGELKCTKGHDLVIVNYTDKGDEYKCSSCKKAKDCYLGRYECPVCCKDPSTAYNLCVKCVVSKKIMKKLKENGACEIKHKTAVGLQPDVEEPPYCCMCGNLVKVLEPVILCPECTDFAVCFGCATNSDLRVYLGEFKYKSTFKNPGCKHKTRMIAAQDKAETYTCGYCNAKVSNQDTPFYCSTCNKIECLRCALTDDIANKVKTSCSCSHDWFISLAKARCIYRAHELPGGVPIVCCGGCSKVLCLNCSTGRPI